MLLIIGLFSNWVVALDGVFGLTPFGIKISFMGFSETATYFELFQENFVIALTWITIHAIGNWCYSYANIPPGIPIHFP